MTTTTTPFTDAAAVVQARDDACKAIRSAWRRKPAPGVIRALRDDEHRRLGTSRRVWCDVSNATSTACWRLEPTFYGARHKILLGEQAALSIDTTAKGSHRLTLAFLRALLRHETAHARYTLLRADGAEMAMATVQDAVKSAGIPWELWNLFEDARIEAAERKRAGAPFDWRKWWTLRDTDDATRYLWSTVQAEAPLHGRTAAWTGAPRTVHPDTGAWHDTRDLITSFWSRACDAADVLALIPLMQEWMRIFGAAVDATLPTYRATAPGDKPGSGPSGVGYSASAETATSPAGPAPATIYTEDYRVAQQTYSQMATSLAWFGTERGHGRSLANVVDRWKPVDYTARVQGTVATFRRLRGIRDSVRQQVSQAGSRLHFRNVISGEPSAFRTTSQRHGKRKLVVIMDMSGSMHSSFQEHGAAFLHAMHQLRLHGDIDATLILSGGGRNAIVPRDMPVALFDRLDARHGCESIQQTLAAHRDLLIAADTVLIYTDGNLTDGDVDAGRWRSLGVDLIGVCASDHDMVRRAMESHFACVITAPNGHQLSTRILDYVTRR